MHTQRRYATCPKSMSERKEKMHTYRRYATCSQGMSKKMYSSYPWKIKERDGSWQGVSHITIRSIHSIHMHVLITVVWFDFFMDSIFDFTIYEMQVCLFFYLALELHKSPLVGKEKRHHCPGEDIHIEWFERIIWGTLPCFLKTFLWKISRWIADLEISEYGSIHYFDSQQLKTRRRLKAPWMSMG